MFVSKFVIDQNAINNEFKILNNILNQQRQLKKTLLLYLEKISEGINNTSEPQDSNSLFSCLDNIKLSFENIKNNINKIIELKNYLQEITNTKNLDSASFEEYNNIYLNLFEKITDDNIFYYSFMESLLKYMKVVFPEIHQNTEIINIEEIPEIPEISEKTNSESNFLEHTLIICKKDNKAILPYTISELEEYFSNNPEKYTSLQDIIDKEYTISLNNYTNHAFSRFKEGFNLAKKENISFIKSLDLANELFFNTNLHPVIITACKSLEQLNIYLSCLEDNILDQFKIFNIKYI